MQDIVRPDILGNMEKFPRRNLESEHEDIPAAELADMETSPVTAEEMQAEKAAMQEALAEANEPAAESLANMKARQEQEDQARLKDLRSELGLKGEEEIKADEERIHKIMMDAITGDGKSGPENPESAARAEKEPGQNPPERPPEEDGEDDDGDGEGGAEKAENEDSVVSHSQKVETKHKLCERCGGTGRRYFFFRCGVCRGTGAVVASQSVQTSQQVVRRTARASQEKPPENAR